MATNKMPPRLARIALFAICLSYGVLANGAALDYEFAAGVGHTDNMARTSQNGADETLKSAGVRFSLEQDSRRVEGDLLGDLQLTDYSSAYSTDLTGNLTGRLGFALVEDRLKWDVEDNFGQVQRDLFAVPTPQNRENVNYFSTGPQLFLPMGRATSLLLAGRYTRIDFEDSPGSSSQVGGWVAVQRRLPHSGILGLNFQGEQIRQDDDGIFPTYERLQAFLRYELNGARSTVLVDIGANRLDLSDGRETGALLRLEMARNVGRFSRILLGAGQEFTDAGSSLQPGRAQLALPETTTDFQLQTQQPYTSRYATLGWELAGRYTRIMLNSRWEDEEYVGGEAVDVRRRSVDLFASRDLGPHTAISMAARFSTSDFATQVGSNDESSYILALSRAFGRRLGMELSAERYDFDFDTAGANAGETRFWLRLTYGDTLGRSRSP